ncbi:SH3 domain-containing protein [Thiothrix lacustris]|uniref:SH3 domain-containing protein n=1 Tax=Thiothrix lacustris TaxID=525917 RepID=UPI0006858F08|nr:SH3 domain-containing protein [Thiothrix lacustris]
MKKNIQGFLLGAVLLLPLHSYAASFNCAKAKTWSEKTVCNTKQLSHLDELLAASFQKALDGTRDKAALKAEEGEWLTTERNACTDVDCLKEAYTSRLAVLNNKIANAEEAPATESDTSTGWYKAIAQPNLTVRNSADVTGKKLGNVPYGGKVKVLARTDKTDSIGGRDGTWVKIEWQGKTAYTFDAFLEKLAASESKAKAAGKTLEGTITAYECGDNCYLTITDKQGVEHSGLCSAPLCDAWNEVAEMPAKFKNKKVKASVGTGTQYDGSGTTAMGEMDAFEAITLLK